MFWQYKSSPVMTSQQMMRMNNMVRAAAVKAPVAVEKQLENQAKRPSTTRNLYIEIEIKNTGLTEESVVLFDALDAYADQQNYVQPGTISITGVSKNYQLVLNKLLTSKYIATAVHLETLEGKETQFARPMSFWDDTLQVDNIGISQTLYPSAGRNSMQQLRNLVELANVNKIIDSNTAFVFNLIPQNTLLVRIYLQEVSI